MPSLRFQLRYCFTQRNLEIRVHDAIQPATQNNLPRIPLYAFEFTLY